MNTPPLQPLRIPAGWTVKYNNGLYEIDPNPELSSFQPTQEVDSPLVLF